MRLIDADALIKRHCKDCASVQKEEPEGCEYCLVVREVKKAPTVDAVPVRYGRWEWDTEDVYACTLCGEKSHVKEVMEKPDWLYCPNCGAKMDGGAEDATD